MRTPFILGALLASTSAFAADRCTFRADDYHLYSIGTQQLALSLLPGGIVELAMDHTCVVLGFTAIKDGEAVYTDDGQGRGLTVIFRADGTLDVTHIAGWRTIARAP